MKPTLTLLTGLLLAPLTALHAADVQKPNIIFIYADDWGWGDLGCHGSTWLKTPNLDRLASQGTDFRQFNVLNPVCSPSRKAALTGMYPARFSVHQHFADPAQNARVYDSAASWSCSPIAHDPVLPSPRLNGIDTRLGIGFRGSMAGLHGPLLRTLKTEMLPSLPPGGRPKPMANRSSYDSFILYSKPVYPGTLRIGLRFSRV